MFELGANDFSIKDLEDFLSGEGAVSPAAEDEESPSATQPNESDNDTNADTASASVTEDTNVTETQAFARRLKSATTKARNEDRESIAKSFGDESYAAMQKAREDEMLKSKGFDPEEVSPVVEELVQKRLAEDPRLKEFDTFKQERVNAWAQGELAELKELTDGKITKFEDIPKEVIESWKVKGSLKKAYLEHCGEALLKEVKTQVASGQNRGSTNHLGSPQGAPTSTNNLNKRPYTQHEKDVYKLFNPGVTDEELSKLYKEI